MSQVIQQADSEFAEYERGEMSFSEFIEHAQEQPESVVGSVQYLINAIEHYGTTEVVERGEEKERYRFFDDPENNGEHAVLGNTEELNKFVDSLKRKATQEGENNKILWITGPTATGKSEFKRCLLNGIQAYAKTEEGCRWTVEWSLDSLNGSSMTYGDDFGNDKEWYKSPVNVNPLTVLPEDTRQQVISDIEENSDYRINIEEDLDPFSREAFEYLQEEYDGFSEMISEEHLRVVSYIPEVGDGFGVLQSEDVGDAKSKMVGSWMQSAMEEFASRGRKNAQAFTYDGLLSQGNSTVSLVEDAHHHSDLFQKLMNACEEHFVKLDNKITMHIDTLLICVSNPDFEAQIRQYEETGAEDPFKSIRRRLERYDFNYLTSFLLETQLIRKHVLNETEFWGDYSVDEKFEKAREPVKIFDTHFSPHAIEAAAFYSVLTRLGDKGSFNKLTSAERVLFYDRGYHVEGKRRVEIDVDDDVSSDDGKNGIPVTYTADVISRLAQESDDCVMPIDVLEEMGDNLHSEPLFSKNEATDFERAQSNCFEYIDDEMKKDVIKAMLGDNVPSEEDVRDYVESLFAWEDEEDDEYDNYELREFETKHLGIDREEYRDDAKGSYLIEQYRIEKIITPINKYIWNNKSDFDEIPIEESHTLQILLEYDDFSAVTQLYDNVDIAQWRNPPEGSETEELKDKTINNMVDMGYTEESAEKATVQMIDIFEPDFGGEN